jgi:alkylation response protein AidB-like acyl-CoA dehydrogenase
MDFDFSGEQKEIRDQARRLLAAECDLKRVRRVLEGEASYDAALWKRIAAQGWLAVAIPEAYGGLAMGQATLCVIAEELGRSLAPVPVSSSIYLAAQAILLAGDEKVKQAYLPALASGDKIGTLACAEGMAPLAATNKVTTRYADGALTGTKLPVPDGTVADFAMVSARVDSRSGEVTGLFLVDLAGPGIERQLLDCIDPTRPQARIVFDHAPAQPLGGAEVGAATLRRVLDSAAVLTAFEQIGGADAALAMSAEYAKIRHAFGRPIGSFQAIKHKLADMYVRNELARSNAYYAAWALDAQSAELPLAAAAARVAASEAYEYAAKETIQTHGGIGATWEADMHLFYRRARLLMLLLDSPPCWRNRLVSELERRAVA